MHVYDFTVRVRDGKDNKHNSDEKSQETGRGAFVRRPYAV